MEVLKPGQHHAEPEFAMSAGVPARDRHRLDVGLPDLIGPREAAQAALHEGRAFAQDELVVEFLHRLAILPLPRHRDLLHRHDECRPQHFLNFFPLPQGHGSFLPTLVFRSGWRGRLR